MAISKEWQVFPLARQWGCWIIETAMWNNTENSFQNNKFSQDFSYFSLEILKLPVSFLFDWYDFLNVLEKFNFDN